MAVSMTLENDVEVGESLPPMTEHVSRQCMLRSAFEYLLTIIGCQRLAADMESECGLRRGRGMGTKQNEDRLPQVRPTCLTWEVSHTRRFFIHKIIERYAAAIVQKHGDSGERAMLFPSHATACRCYEFLVQQAPEVKQHVRVLDLVPTTERARSDEYSLISPHISAVLFPAELFGIAKSFWQHSGDGVSSRRAEYSQTWFDKGMLVDSTTIEELARVCKGPKRYQRKTSVDISNEFDAIANGTVDEQDPIQFVEQRFGRNLDMSLTRNAKLAVRRRIAGSLTADVDLREALTMETDEEMTRQVPGFSEDDIYLYPCGMSSIFNAHRNLMATRGEFKSIVYGQVTTFSFGHYWAHDNRFPYIDTLKIIDKFGPGSLFYGFGSSEELDDLEKRLEKGERFLALFTEFPGNPLLRSPDLERIRGLADKYDFYVVVDETIGNFINVNVLPYADVVVSSLTKVFSGDSNVMGGR
jgi:cystathionine gamma-synthase